MAEQLKLEVILNAIGNAAPHLKAIDKAGGGVAKTLKAAKDQLKQLNQVQNNASGFQRMSKDLAITNNQLTTARKKVSDISTEIEKSGVPTKAMSDSLRKATREVADLERKSNTLEQSLYRERVALNNANTAVNNLAHTQDVLKLKTYAAAGEIKRQTQLLEQQSKVVQRTRAAQERYQKGLDIRNKIAGAGATTTAAGAAVGYPVLKLAKDYADFETAMLGVARQVQGAKDNNGKLTPLYYEMGEAIKQMSERLPLTANEIAKITEGAARMGVQGKADLLAFTETAAIMAAAFDLPVEQFGDDMGQIAGLYKIPIQNMKDLGDTVNWLDDNALSKGGDIIDVMKRIAGQATMVGMSYKDAAALGSSFLSLGASSEVAATASNAMMARLANAPILASSKRYAGGLAMLNLDAEKLQKNMSINSTGTILEVLEAIRKLPKEKQLEASTRIFGVEYGDDASKLAVNLAEYRRQLKLVNDEQARGSMQRESDTRNQTLDAQTQMTMNSLRDLSSEIGQGLKPALLDVLTLIRDMAQSTRDWVKEHPILVSYLVKAAAALAVITIGVGGLMLAIATIMGPMLLFRLGLGIASAQGIGMAGSVLNLTNKFSILRMGATRLLGPLGLLWGAWEVGYKIGTLLNGVLDSIATSLNHGKQTTLGSLIYDVTHGQGPSTTDARGKPRIANKPPIQSNRNNGNTTITHAPQITVHASPGMDEKTVAKHVASELAKQNRRVVSSRRSSLQDRN